MVVLGPGGAGFVLPELSPRGWQNLYHNPVAVLREVSEYELRVHLQDSASPTTSARAARFRAYLNEPEHLGHQNAPQLHKNPVAYFSAEFGFHESLPISAGGLGILAGDHAKSASDLGLGFSASACFTARAISSRRLIRTTGRRSITTLLDPQKCRLEPVLDAEGEPLVSAWKST
jgi:starch phosphorylase